MAKFSAEDEHSDHEIIEFLRIKISNIRFSPEDPSKNITNVSFFHSDKLQQNIENVFSFLEKMNYLKQITIADSPIKKLPESIGNLITLEHLDLRRNNLISLPDSFGNLTSLRHLELSNNQLSFLPDSFGNLVKLESLNLQKNNIIYLPDSFKNLKKLRSLDLRDNKLRSFSNLPLSIRESKYLSDTVGIPDYAWDRIDKMMVDFAPPEGHFELGVMEMENEYDWGSDEFEFVDMYLDGYRLLEGNLPFFKNISDNVWDNEDNSEMTEDLHNNDGFQDSEQFYKYYNENKKEFYKYYEKSPLILAQQYIQDPKSLTQDGKGRLAWEGSFRERGIIEMKVQPDDPILLKINKRLTLEFPNNKDLKLMK